MAEHIPDRTAAGARVRSQRRAILVIAALLGAGGCALAAGLEWWGRDFDDPLRGSLHVGLSGADLIGELIPIALVALAGIGAMIAVRGWWRRAIGVLISLAGVLEIVRCAAAASDAPLRQLADQLVRPATPIGPATLAWWAVVAGIAGGALLMVAGVLIVVSPDPARKSPSVYESPAARRERVAAQRTASGKGSVDAGDPAELWRAIDAGTDPTDDGPTPGPEHPVETDTMSSPDDNGRELAIDPESTHTIGGTKPISLSRPATDEEARE